jgi:UDP-2-acetamido-3-amino-2,3-dideoxy-glucuronate N-acetyltransferase
MTHPASQANVSAADRYFKHESAYVDHGAVVGDGTRIWHFSHVCSGARLGRGCVLGQNVYVAPSAVLGDGVRVQNNVSIYDGVVLEDGVFVGPSAVFTNVSNPRAEVPTPPSSAATQLAAMP